MEAELERKYGGKEGLARKRQEWSEELARERALDLDFRPKLFALSLRCFEPRLVSRVARRPGRIAVQHRSRE